MIVTSPRVIVAMATDYRPHCRHCRAITPYPPRQPALIASENTPSPPSSPENGVQPRRSRGLANGFNHEAEELPRHASPQFDAGSMAIRVEGGEGPRIGRPGEDNGEVDLVSQEAHAPWTEPFASTCAIGAGAIAMARDARSPERSLIRSPAAGCRQQHTTPKAVFRGRWWPPAQRPAPAQLCVLITTKNEGIEAGEPRRGRGCVHRALDAGW